MEEELFNRVLDCGKELGQKITGVTIKGNYGKVLVFYFKGVTRTLNAIQVLYDLKFYEEAFSLVRLLLESAIDLDFIQLNREGRAKQFLEFDMFKTNEMADLQQELKGSLSSQERYKISFKFKNKAKWSQISVEKMLEEIYSTDERTKDSHLLLYKHCCSFSHPSALTLGAEVFFDDKEFPIRKAYKENMKMTLPTLSCQLTLKIYYIVNNELGLECFPQIDQISKDVARIAGQILTLQANFEK